MHFIEIINNFKSLGKTYTNKEVVRRVSRYLPRSKWEPKGTTIEEAQDLKTLTLHDLVEKLLTHEIHLQEETKKQAIAARTHTDVQ